MPPELPRLGRALMVLLALALSSQLAWSASPVTKEEIAATATWFDGLQWPDVRGKPYVEIMFGQGQVGAKIMDGPKVRGFLLAEDAQSWTVFSDGTVAQRGFFSGGGWPLVVQRIQKSPPDAGIDSKFTSRVIELPAAVKELLAELRRPKDQDEKQRATFGRKASDRTAVFVLARCCAQQGHADLAEQLDQELITLSAEPWGQSGDENLGFRAGIEKEIAHVLMWKAVVDCGDASVTRPELLAQFERVVRDFPASEHHERAAGFVDLLRSMVAEDEAHARTARPIEQMTADEKVHELIFRLRDQNGHQWSQPGSCDIFDEMGGRSDGNSPAHQLVKIGYPAVPALIEALGDKHLSRSVGFHRDFYFSHFVLTVGDCAEAVLSRIAGRNFWVARTTSAAMQKDGQLKATRDAVEAWWRGVQGKGEKKMLIEGVRSGGDDSAEQAGRLAALDPAAALEAIAAGLRAAKSNWVRTQLVEAIAAIKGDAATKALHREMMKCASLHGRVAAATELFRRGEKAGVPAMIDEWKKWKPSPRAELDDDPEDAEPLITFLGTCGEVPAMKALADRFGSVPIEVQFQIIDAVADLGLPFERVRGEKAPLPPEVEKLAEDLIVTALENRSARYGMSGTRNHNISFHDPRVCDMAAYALSERWPQRYQFQWSPTEMERDPQILKMRNVWRVAHGQEALPIPERHKQEVAAQQPNTVSSLTWTGGAPLTGVQIAEGQPLTADKLIETVALLHRTLPKTLVGFDFTAERAGDGRGFFVTVHWASRMDINPGGASWPGGGGGWSIHLDIIQGDESLYNSTGGSSVENRGAASGYDAERRALTKAFASDASQKISIIFSSRLIRGKSRNK